MQMSKKIRIFLVLFCGLGFLRSFPLLPPSFQDQPDQRMRGIFDLHPTPAAVNETINETEAPVILFDSVMLFNLTIVEFLLSLFMEKDRVPNPLRLMTDHLIKSRKNQQKNQYSKFPKYVHPAPDVILVIQKYLTNLSFLDLSWFFEFDNSQSGTSKYSIKSTHST